MREHETTFLGKDVPPEEHYPQNQYLDKLFKELNTVPKDAQESVLFALIELCNAKHPEIEFSLDYEVGEDGEPGYPWVFHDYKQEESEPHDFGSALRELIFRAYCVGHTDGRNEADSNGRVWFPIL